jgi:hypothetical protein
MFLISGGYHNWIHKHFEALHENLNVLEHCETEPYNYVLEAIGHAADWGHNFKPVAAR